MRRGIEIALAWGLASWLKLVAAAVVAADAPVEDLYVRRGTWQESVLASLAAWRAARLPEAERWGRLEAVWRCVEQDHPVQHDWVLQDGGPGILRALGEETATARWRAMAGRAIAELGPEGARLEAAAGRLGADLLGAAPGVSEEKRWLDLYVEACERRRDLRLRPLLARCGAVVFTKHFDLGGSHYAYTEAQSDAQHERSFEPGSSLCVLELDGGKEGGKEGGTGSAGSLRGRVRALLEDPGGVIRDPDVSWDGKRILFAWKKSDREDDYHLYELEVETSLGTAKVRQLTSGLGFADYEGQYLPGGDIVFSSTRCVQTVDCWWTEVSNLYACDPDGGSLRRLGFDQVHTNYPTVTSDGRVIYTRWEYSDRGQIFPQGLFQMGPDGTGQAELYGNSSWFPTTIAHARGVPGSAKVVAVAAGHHTRQAGKLILIDPARGRQENEGVQLVAPVRETPAVRVDAYGQQGELFQHPYPMSETEYLVAYAPHGWARRPALFGIYFMTADGRRELLAWDQAVSCSQPVPLAPRPRPSPWPSTVDYLEATGTYHVQDVYSGDGLEGIPRGTIRRLRVVALDFRAAGIGANYNRGPGGRALVSTPVAVSNGSWDVKVVLGEAEVHHDGSACFTVPARTPVYFQAIDERGHAVQTMRSWSTLQPGETRSCGGCHESKNAAPPARSAPTLASRAGPRPLEPFHGPPRGFSFAREVQPILDRRCVRCHHDRSGVPEPVDESRADGPSPRVAPFPPPSRGEVAFSLLGEERVDPQAKRRWSDAYLALTQGGRPSDLVNWISVQSAPPVLPPYHAGAARSRLLALLEAGHRDVSLSRGELEVIACWIDLLVPCCGDYTESNAWTEEEARKYRHFLEKRRRMEAIERRSIEALAARRGAGG
ncbi:MAG: hypothetical protein HY721_07750 [Planctomycetes bacterium]|nr:hypothetical protein [Planctomycetota bacterium]